MQTAEIVMEKLELIYTTVSTMAVDVSGGSSRRGGISRHDTDLVLLEYSIHCTREGKGIVDHRDSKVHGANMGPIWGRQDPCGPHVGPMNFAIWATME